MRVIGTRRLERLRQNHSAEQGHPAACRARREGLDPQACASQFRRRSAGQGFLHPSHGGRDRGADLIRNRYALMHELRGAPEPTVTELLKKLSPVDLVIIEGWKVAHYAKIEVYRKEVGKPPLHPDDPFIHGIASDVAFPKAGRPVVALDRYSMRSLR